MGRHVELAVLSVCVTWQRSVKGVVSLLRLFRAEFRELFNKSFCL
jgi:hypothetical protein